MAYDNKRPLSPFMLGSVYRFQITSLLSITHRITGIALTVGSVLLVAWLWSAAYSAECYNWLMDLFAHPVVLAMLIGWTFALYYHLANGIRHLFWDAGYGFGIHNATRSGIAVILFTVLMTSGSWFFIFQHVGYL